MRSLTLSLRFDDDVIHPMHAFIAERERYRATRLLQWNATGEGTYMMLFQVDGPLEPYASALDEVDSIVSYETASTSTSGRTFHIIVRDRIAGIAHGIVDAYASESVVVVPPVIFRTDRSAEMTIVGRVAALQGMVDRIPERMSAEVRRIKTAGSANIDPGTDLTGRQRDVLTAAAKAGYYTEPRDATIADVADQLGVAPGTVAEHLRKAEARLVENALGDLEDV